MLLKSVKARFRVDGAIAMPCDTEINNTFGGVITQCT